MSVEVKVFSAVWCSSCTGYKKALKDSGIEHTLYDADNDDHQEEFRKYGVRGLPTTVIVKDGVVADTFTGTKSVSAIQELIEGK